MLHTIILLVALVEIYGQAAPSVKEKPIKPYMFPIPFELPNRNDKADQCYIRIEDVDITETLVVKCYIAHDFLRSYIHDYNAIKMTEDDVNVSLWSERPRNQEDTIPKIPENDFKGVKDWKTTTVLDPITGMRLYVTQKADCRLVMYSREGMSNYNVDCAPFLYFVNDRISGSGVFLQGEILLIAICFFLISITSPISN
ncbi:uncharacterized protein LOC132904452 [Amyelois transitella]|uniref:uncharacterized protein LOC132904452 n=1 Tax=Amyelois transitella TaxID=680683 RepID=UPI00298F70AB|nr:uncharacterized protein LOC132904452 [Amyelois transitella]